MDLNTELSFRIGLLFLIGISLAVVAILILGIVALKKGDCNVRSISQFLVKASALELLSIAIVVDGVVILALEDKLDASAAAILAGITGYVLGEIGRKKANRDDGD